MDRFYSKPSYQSGVIFTRRQRGGFLEGLDRMSTMMTSNPNPYNNPVNKMVRAMLKHSYDMLPFNQPKQVEKQNN